jgi:hypothetical protein
MGHAYPSEEVFSPTQAQSPFSSLQHNGSGSVSMYEPFPGNYVWNLSVNICIGMGGAIGEIDSANERVREVAKQGEDAGTEAFFSAWMTMADRVAALADEDGGRRNFLSAAEKFGRATAYYITAERMQSRHYEPRKQAYRTMLNTLQRMIVAGSLNCERVEIPYGKTHFPALFVRGNGPGPRPCVVFCNGLDTQGDDLSCDTRRVRETRHLLSHG